MIPVTLEIPDWLANGLVVTYLILVFVCFFTLLLAAVTYSVSWSIRHRRVYGFFITLLTWKRTADWTFGMHHRCAELLRKDDDPLYYMIRHQFNRRTPSEPKALPGESGYEKEGDE